MPSSPPVLRPLLAALTAVLVLVAPLLIGPSAQAAGAASAVTTGGAAATEAAPTIPPADDDAPVALDLVSLGPTALAPGGTLTAEVEVTNTSDDTLEEPALALRTRSARVTERTDLASWEAETAPDTSGEPVGEAEGDGALAPGASTTLRIEAPADELGFSAESYYWGTRRISLTVTDGGTALASLRTFVVWRPDGAEGTVTRSVLLPVTAADPAQAVTDPEADAESRASGRLASLSALAVRDDVDWWLDPALLDAPALETAETATEGEDDAAPEEGTDGTPTPEDDVDGAEATTPAEGEDAEQPVASYVQDPAATALADTLTGAAEGRSVLAMPYAQGDLVALEAAGATTLVDALRARSEGTWEASGVQPETQALAVAGPEATPSSLAAAAATGTDTLLVPTSSLRVDPTGSVTPSSVGTWSPTGEAADTVRVLAPDPVLSSEFSQLTGDTDGERVTQRLLAETATVASEYTTAPRHLLIAPELTADLDAGAAGTALDALGEAPWLAEGRTGELLQAADDGALTTDPRADGEELYALGALGPEEVAPSAPDEHGVWDHTAEVEEPELLTASEAAQLESAWGDLETLGAILEDEAVLDAPRLVALSGASVRWRDNPGVPGDRARRVLAEARELTDRVHVVPASGYNLISDSAGVPITVTNGLDTPITVRLSVTSDRPLVQIPEQPVVEVPARGEVSTTVPVEAIANGSVTLTTTVTTEDGQALGDPVQVPLTVNPAWENWTTLLLVIGMGSLVVVGVLRARRTGSSSRAPAVHGPEDPVELARSGRSRPDDPARSRKERA